MECCFYTRYYDNFYKEYSEYYASEQYQIDALNKYLTLNKTQDYFMTDNPLFGITLINIKEIKPNLYEISSKYQIYQITNYSNI